MVTFPGSYSFYILRQAQGMLGNVGRRAISLTGLFLEFIVSQQVAASQ